MKTVHWRELFVTVAEKGRSQPRDMEMMKPLLQMVFHCIDKMKRFKLSKEVNIFWIPSLRQLESVQRWWLSSA